MIAIDAGHGFGNRNRLVYDPGAVAEHHGRIYEEASIALHYALCLENKLRGQSFLTRWSQEQSCPLSSRAAVAGRVGASAFLSLHLNSAVSARANGVEVLYRKDKDFAEELVDVVCSASGLKNRGAKHRPRLSVLQFSSGPAALIELGFISNVTDRSTLVDVIVIDEVCESIANFLRSNAGVI